MMSDPDPSVFGPALRTLRQHARAWLILTLVIGTGASGVIWWQTPPRRFQATAVVALDEKQADRLLGRLNSGWVVQAAAVSPGVDVVAVRREKSSLADVRATAATGLVAINAANGVVTTLIGVLDAEDRALRRVAREQVASERRGLDTEREALLRQILAGPPAAPPSPVLPVDRPAVYIFAPPSVSTPLIQTLLESRLTGIQTRLGEMDRLIPTLPPGPPVVVIDPALMAVPVAHGLAAKFQVAWLASAVASGLLVLFWDYWQRVTVTA